MGELKTIVDNYQPYIFFCIMVLATVISAILAGKFMQRKIVATALDHRIGVTSFVFLKHIVLATIYFLGFGWALLSLPITHTFAHSLLAGAGATTLILGFASQQLFTNLISGVFLVLNRPFKIDDIIEFQGSKGKVIEINLNSTLLQDDEGNQVIIPSSLLLSDKLKIISRAEVSRNSRN